MSRETITTSTFDMPFPSFRSLTAADAVVLSRLTSPGLLHLPFVSASEWGSTHSQSCDARVPKAMLNLGRELFQVGPKPTRIV